MRFLTIWALIAFLALTDGRRKIYTEEDEAKFLQQLKQQELRDFEMQMREESKRNGVRYSSSMYGVQLEGVSVNSEELPSELRGPVAPWSRRTQQREQTQALALRAQPAPEFAIEKSDDTTFKNSENGEHWCYLCASPIDDIKPEMRRSIRNLLEMRRTAFPVDAVTSDCLSARNLTKLKKQTCTYKYCQTLSIVDKNAGKSFVVRGCAEHFGAINVPELEKKDDHSCNMLHEKLDIKECICKTDKYCNAGWIKRSPNSVSQQSSIALATFFVIVSFLI
uniref:Uncharacterized protein n=1 Tax=Caenorhabditis tropicalis TaxID=1561998 RepID=A0A1I7U0J0_9PELO